jgi:hypothetical protein
MAWPAFVLRQAAEADRQWKPVAVQVRNGEPVDEPVVARERVSDDAKTERTSQLAVNAPAEQVLCGIRSKG